MPGFTDCLGRQFELRLTVADLKPLREMGLDAAKLMTSLENLPDVLFGDAERLATVAHRLSRTDLPADQFAEGIDGPTLERIGVALVEACVDFFPLSRTAQAMKGRVRAGLDELDETLVRTLSSVSVGSSAGSSASTPAR